MYNDKKFELFHLFYVVLGLLVLEGILFQFLPANGTSLKEAILLLCSAIGAAVNIYIAIEAIEKVKGQLPVLTFLFLIILEFIVFFAFEYWYLLLVDPASFPTVAPNMLSLLLHSTMVFVLNPLYLPSTPAGEGLLLINTLCSLGIVIFILQNIWQLHHLGHNQKGTVHK